MAFADPDDVITRWIGEGAPTDNHQLAVLIQDAETIIRREFPTIDARIGAPLTEAGVSAADVTLVVVGMVIRLLRNPEAIRNRQESLGAWSGGVTYATDGRLGMSLAPDDRKVLSGGADDHAPVAFTISPTGDGLASTIGGSGGTVW